MLKENKMTNNIKKKYVAISALLIGLTGESTAMVRYQNIYQGLDDSLPVRGGYLPAPKIERDVTQELEPINMSFVVSKPPHKLGMPECEGNAASPLHTLHDSANIINSKEELEAAIPNDLFIQDVVDLSKKKINFFSKRILSKLSSKKEKKVRTQKFLNTFKLELEYNEDNFVQYDNLEDQKSYYTVIYGRNNKMKEMPKINVKNSRIDGTGLKRNIREINPETCEKLHEMAKKGNAMAIYNIGLIYAHLGDSDAITYFKLAAKAGHKTSAIALAEIFRGGLFDEPKNPFLAKKLAEVTSTSETSYQHYGSKIHNKVAQKFKNCGHELSRRIAREGGIYQKNGSRAAASNARRNIKFDKLKDKAKGVLTSVWKKLTSGV
jgi:hypothetical protein